MRQTLTKRQLILGAMMTAVLALMLVIAMPSSSYAQSEQATAEEAAQEAESTSPETEGETGLETADADNKADTPSAPAATFTYTANECDALTFMVRKSLNLFDAANDDISLSQEATIYAETNIVAAMGARLLEIGEEVTVDSELVEKFARSSQDLTPAQIDAWSQFTANVDFELDDIVPTQDTSEAVTPATERAEAAQAEAGAANGAAGDGLSEADTVEDSDGASPIWWVVGGGAVGGLWYLLYRRSDEA